MTFSDQQQYAVGDIVSMVVYRSWLDIWWERATTLRWHVAQTETISFRCTDTRPGSIWPSVDR